MPTPSPTNLWLHGLAAAFVTGLSNGILLVMANSAFDIFKDGKSLAIATAATTLTSVASYLKQSPVPNIPS